MRNKLFLGLAMLIILTVFLWAPFAKVADSLGWIELSESKNYIEPERTHTGLFADQLNAWEQGKAAFIDMYTNYFPGYGTLVRESNLLERRLNQPVNDRLSDLAAEAKKEYLINEMFAVLRGEKEMPPRGNSAKPAETTPASTPVDTPADTSVDNPIDTSTDAPVTEPDVATTPATTPAADAPVTDVPSTTPATNAPTTDVPATTPATDAPAPETDAPKLYEPLPSEYDGLPYTVTYINKGKSYRNYKIEFELENGDTFAFLDRAISTSMEDVYKKADLTVRTVNGWAEIVNELGGNLYFYMATRLQDTPLSAKYFPDEYSTEEPFKYVLENIDPSVQTDYLRIGSLGDRLEKQFLSDHHWTAKGSYEGYCQIIDMMQENYPDMADPIVPVGYYTLDGVIYCGYYSEATWDYFVWDTFAWYDYGLRDFPMMEARYHSQKKSQELYLAGKHENNPNGASYHYESFHGITHHIHNDTNYGRNLLVIGDSFLRPIGEPLSSHYDDTYFIHYWEAKSGYDLEKYMKERNITDVLLIGTTVRFVGDLYDDAVWENIY